MIFDPHNIEHIKAYQALRDYGSWPPDYHFGYTDIAEINKSIIMAWVDEMILIDDALGPINPIGDNQ